MKININELENIDGIGEKTIQKVRTYCVEKDSYYECKYDPQIHTDINNVYLGDCLKLMNGIPDNSIDMILADLPYGSTQNENDKRIDLYELWTQYERIIKNHGAIVLTADFLFGVSLVNSNSDLFRYDLVWNKRLPTGFLNANRMPLRSHEHILVFYKHLPTYNPQFWEGEPLHSKGYTYKEKEHKNRNYGEFDNANDSRAGTTKKYPRSILNFDKPHPSIALHPTQNPVNLFEYLIKTYTNEGDLVLDNVAGSGTTGAACQNLNRDFILIEKEKEYFDIIKERLNL